MKTSEIKKIYNEFGLDIHNIEPNLQSKLNSIIKELITLREKLNSKKIKEYVIYEFTPDNYEAFHFNVLEELENDVGVKFNFITKDLLSTDQLLKSIISQIEETEHKIISSDSLVDLRIKIEFCK